MLSTAPHLPLELYDKIISELHSNTDSDTLKSLALSCRSLVTPSQKLLFSHIILRSPHTKCCSRMAQFGGTSSAFKILLELSPHISHNVRFLAIFDDPHRSLSESDEMSCPIHLTTNWFPHDEDLHFCLSAVQKLEAFTFTYASTSVPEPPSWDEVSPTLVCAIRRLLQLPSLIYVDLQHSPILSLLKGTGSTIKHLVMHRVYANPVIEASLTPIIPPPTYLESLCIEEFCQMDVLVPILLGLGESYRTISLYKLKKLPVTLEVNQSLIKVHQNLQRILEECKDSLQEFILAPSIDVIASPMNAVSFIDRFREPLDLSILKSLKQFITYLEFSNSIDGIYDSMPWFINLLRCGCADYPSLANITCYLDINYKTRNGRYHFVMARNSGLST
ncbi:hypothetical protein CPB83DRAFT_908202 [Crepidotus variabilis]|uniref:F-box domain-containing protein n=1 Tax=Crepidotus variabilis TaxID=179855 RepID=A0A9P6JNE9_9AGAR|nr:hypothetical protein CPB83DRAFT_908202 [Crepidotus variabilis]